MGQIGTPLKVVEIPKPEIAPTYDPPARTPEAEPIPMEPILVPEKVPVRAPAKVPEKEPALV